MPAASRQRTLRAPAHRRGPCRAREGFTLIELLVVTLIVAILATIAIPVFLGQRARAQDAQAKSAVNNVLRTVALIAGERDDFLLVGSDTHTTEKVIDKFRVLEPAFAYTPGESTGPRMASVRRIDADTAVFAVKSESGACYWARWERDDRPFFGKNIIDECDTSALDGGEETLIAEPNLHI